MIPVDPHFEIVNKVIEIYSREPELDEAGRVVREERFLTRALGRIRDVETGPDGLVYLLTDEDPGGLYRLEPAAGAG